MKNSKTFLFIITLFFVYTSCKKNERVIYLNQLKNKISIMKETPVKPLNKEQIGNTYLINNLHDKYLIINDTECTDNGLLIYDINNFKKLGATGKKGEGPGEISYYYKVIPYKHGFIMQDHSKNIVYYYDVVKAIKNQNYLPLELLHQKDIKDYPYFYRMLSDSLYVGVQARIGSSSNFEVNINKGNLYTGTYKKMISLPNEIDNNKLQCYFASYKNRIIITYFNYNLVSIYDIKGNLIKHIQGEVKLKKNKHKRYYGRPIGINNKLFIPSFYGDGYMKNSRGIIEEVGFNQLLCLDMNGNYIKTLKTSSNFYNAIPLPDKKRILLYRRKNDIAFTTIHL
ncbi:hypothetical protein K5X82_08090 [Halosquirtibacter xylanolyticus]|uniref:hypothetical protein n=1 Tax=Halosquirtibacter xylanolyticus TaxID=3374599 RepID=UPI00374A6864|nr:hypothetical protein K5X82_08090 [Prolixibacteraceae bacterium]